jgi:hypothetical protein
MDNILLVHYHDYINGCLTSIIDLFLNLKKYKVPCQLKIFTVPPIEISYQTFKQNNFFGIKRPLQSFTKQKTFDSDVIICSSKFLKDCIENNLQIKCKKIVILDSFDLTKSYYNEIADIQSFLESIDQKLFLCNPSNFEKVRFPFVEYYHKFNKKRLDTLKKTGILIYNRVLKDTIYVKNQGYFENIGKTIFETIYHLKDVYYLPDGMFERDGLYYYLKLFDIDGELEHKPLSITKEDIEEKLLMNKDDKILNILGV